MAHPVQDLLRPHRQPMIGLGADQGRRALDRVDPAHLAAGFVRAAPRGKLPGIGEPPRHGGNQIALDRKDHVGGADIQDALDWPAEGMLRRGKLVVAMQRLPLMPAHCRKLLLQCSDLRGEGGRSDIAGQQPQPVAAARQEPVAALVESRDETLPGIDLTITDDRLRAARIIERQDRRLHDRAGTAEAGRMVGVTLDLDRPRHLMGDQDAGRIAVLGRRRRVIARATGHDPGRLFDIREQLARIGLGTAGRQPAQCHRGRHQLQKPPPIKSAEHVSETRHLAFDGCREFRRLRQFLETAPIISARRAHRWHTPQSDNVSGWI